MFSVQFNLLEPAWRPIQRRLVGHRHAQRQGPQIDEVDAQTAALLPPAAEPAAPPSNEAVAVARDAGAQDVYRVSPEGVAVAVIDVSGGGGSGVMWNSR